MAGGAERHGKLGELQQLDRSARQIGGGVIRSYPLQGGASGVLAADDVQVHEEGGAVDLERRQPWATLLHVLSSPG